MSKKYYIEMPGPRSLFANIQIIIEEMHDSEAKKQNTTTTRKTSS